MACTGALKADYTVERTGVVVLDATQSPPKEVERFDVVSKLGTGPSPSITFAGETLLMGTTYGDGAEQNDHAYTIDLSTGAVESVFDGGASYVLGDVRCLPGCGDRCFLADAQAGVVQVWTVQGTRLGEPEALRVNAKLGLPPRGLGEL